MPRGPVAVAAADVLLEFLDFVGEEFDRTAAVGTDHVVMTAAIVLVFVTGDAVVKSDFAGKPALSEELQGAIDGGVADSGVLLFDQAVQFVRGEVLASFEEGLQDRVALSRVFKADTLEVFMKNALRFPHHLRGDGGLVVDALVQRGQGA